MITLKIKEKVGNRIRELRLEKKLSQEALANIAEIDRTYMTSVENGRRNISIETLEKILVALGISFKNFYSHPDFSNE
jgi:transcriptional regulator with XRE-family HTH domain